MKTTDGSTTSWPLAIPAAKIRIPDEIKIRRPNLQSLVALQAAWTFAGSVLPSTWEISATYVCVPLALGLVVLARKIDERMPTLLSAVAMVVLLLGVVHHDTSLLAALVGGPDTAQHRLNVYAVLGPLYLALEGLWIVKVRKANEQEDEPTVRGAEGAETVVDSRSLVAAEK
jgi:hypothetical protein